jgi:hypothetical protein
VALDKAAVRVMAKVKDKELPARMPGRRRLGRRAARTRAAPQGARPTDRELTRPG